MEFPYTIKLPDTYTAQQAQWCQDNLDSKDRPIRYTDELPTVFWFAVSCGPNLREWHFKDKQDFTLFILRWGS